MTLVETHHTVSTFTFTTSSFTLFVITLHFRTVWSVLNSHYNTISPCPSGLPFLHHWSLNLWGLSQFNLLDAYKQFSIVCNSQIVKANISIQRVLFSTLHHILDNSTLMKNLAILTWFSALDLQGRGSINCSCNTGITRSLILNISQ